MDDVYDINLTLMFYWISENPNCDTDSISNCAGIAPMTEQLSVAIFQWILEYKILSRYIMGIDSSTVFAQIRCKK